MTNYSQLWCYSDEKRIIRNDRSTHDLASTSEPLHANISSSRSNHNNIHLNSNSTPRPNSIVETTELFIEETSPPQQESNSGQPQLEDFDSFSSRVTRSPSPASTPLTNVISATPAATSMFYKKPKRNIYIFNFEALPKKIKSCLHRTN